MIRPLATPCRTASDDRDGEWHYRKADAARRGALTALEDLLADPLRVLGPDHPNTLLPPRTAGRPSAWISGYGRRQGRSSS